MPLLLLSRIFLAAVLGFVLFPTARTWGADAAMDPVIPPGTPAVLLKAGPNSPNSGVSPTGASVTLGAQVLDLHDCTVLEHPDMLVLKLDGHRTSSATLRYRLQGQVPPGEYVVWTRFTQGGAATQTFQVKVASGLDADAAAAEDRLAFKQASKSWTMQWRRGEGRLAVYPDDSQLDITVEGLASQRKQIAGFLLVKQDDLPAAMTPDSARNRRQALLKWRGANTEKRPRLLVLEGGNAAETDALYQALATAPQPDGSFVLENLGLQQSKRLATELGLAKLPAAVLLDGSQAVKRIWTGPFDKDASAIAVTELPGEARAAIKPWPGNSQSPSPATASPSAKESSATLALAPVSWLTVGTWAGPAGLSLWGLDYEPQVRPYASQPEAILHFDRGSVSSWKENRADAATGEVTLEQLANDAVWSKASAYAHIYLFTPQARQVSLHLGQTGQAVQGWLNGELLAWQRDDSSDAVKISEPGLNPATNANAEAAEEKDVNDQGGEVTVQRARALHPQMSRLNLAAGWNRLLVKLVTGQRKGERFAFGARLTAAEPDGLNRIQTSLNDPEANVYARVNARRFIPQVKTNAPFNLVRAGEPLVLGVDIGSVEIQSQPHTPFYPFACRLELKVTDYDGREILSREVPFVLPSTTGSGGTQIDLGKAPGNGYYATHLRLLDESGKLITAYPSDGFSVIGGTVAQNTRKAEKKMAVTYYFMGAGQLYKSLYFPYMQRIGIFRNIGGNHVPDVDFFREAQAQGLQVAADMWTHRDPGFIRAYVEESAPYVDVFKSFNEVDIRPDHRGTPEAWVAKAKQEYEIIKQAKPSALMLGASLVRPASDEWFEQCLKLGLADYHDVWDVHCYPKASPVLEGSLSNSPNETDLGVMKVYKKAGMVNTKPFWIGETGARCSHGVDARRWQAAMVAKMVACALSRVDFQKIGFLIPWNYSRGSGRSLLGDIEAGHMPAEASYYTASALIDGFAYTRLSLDASVQAARFGPTTMLWTEAAPRNVTLNSATLKVDRSEPLVAVDVVGRVTNLERRADGSVQVMVNSSPVYVLTRRDYDILTAF